MTNLITISLGSTVFNLKAVWGILGTCREMRGWLCSWVVLSGSCLWEEKVF